MLKRFFLIMVVMLSAQEILCSASKEEEGRIPTAGELCEGKVAEIEALVLKLAQNGHISSERKDEYLHNISLMNALKGGVDKASQLIREKHSHNRSKGLRNLDLRGMFARKRLQKRLAQRRASKGSGK